MGIGIMGIGIMSSCASNPVNPRAIAPNPNLNNWTLISHKQYKNAYVLLVRYHDCTNFEGQKVMVYLGKFDGNTKYLDPHFADNDDSPIARFKPDDQGIINANIFAFEIR